MFDPVYELLDASRGAKVLLTGREKYQAIKRCMDKASLFVLQNLSPRTSKDFRSYWCVKMVAIRGAMVTERNDSSRTIRDLTAAARPVMKQRKTDE